MKKSGKSFHNFEIVNFRLKLVKSKNFGHSWVQGSFGKIREISMFFNEKSEKIVSFELKVRVDK